jgi:hypothetical protein
MGIISICGLFGEFERGIIWEIVFPIQQVLRHGLGAEKFKEYL